MGTKKENILAGLVFLLTFSTYLLTLCPTVSTGDSGELISAAYTLGVPHSPGYPLFCLFGKLFTFIPIGSIAYRVNLMCAFFASLSAVVIYFIIFRLIQRINPETAFINKFLPAVVSSLIYAYSNTFWSQAVSAEVYAIWIFFLSLSFLILIIWTEKETVKSSSNLDSRFRGNDNPRKDYYLYLFSFLYGVSFTCHQLTVFFAPGCLALILMYRPKIWREWKTLFLMFDFFLLGLCLYLYVPLRAAANPGMNWNRIKDINGFVDYLLRRQYGSPSENFSPAYVTQAFNFDFAKFKQLLGYFKYEFSPFCVLFIFGFIPLIFKAKRYLISFLLILIFSGLRIWMNISPQEAHSIYIGRVYLLAGFLIIVVLLGLGIYYLLDFYTRRDKRILYLSLALLIALMPTAPLALNYMENDQSQNFVAYDYGKNILDTLDKDAILLGHGDNALFILAYLKLAEKLRPDVTVYDDISGDVFKETPFDFSSMDNDKKDAVIASLLEKTKRPLYISFGHTLVGTTRHPKELTGIIYRVLREGENVSRQIKEKYWRTYTLRDVFDGYLENKDFLTREIISVYHIALGTYFISMNEAMGISLYHTAAKMAGNTKFVQETLAMYYSLRGMNEEAISAAKKAVSLGPNDPETYYNLGVTYAKAEMYEEAISTWNTALKLNPNFKKAQDYIQKAQELMVKTAAAVKKTGLPGQAGQ